jgi:hypothetical protein
LAWPVHDRPGGLSKNYFMFKVISKTRWPASEAWMCKRFGK